MPSVVEINEAGDLETFRAEWDAIWADTRQATFFQTLDWLTAYLRHFGTTERLRVLLVRGEDGPLGILPLVVRREATPVGPLRVLTYPLNYWGSFAGPLGRHTSATLMAGLHHVANTPRDWDLIDLRWVNTTGLDHGRTGTALALAQLAARRARLAEVALIDLAPGWAAYWESRAPRLRKNLQRLERRLADAGPVELVRYRPRGAPEGDDDPRWDLYDQCCQLAEKSWQSRAGYGNTLSHPEVRGFLREAHAAATARGMVDVALLTVAGEPVAYQYSYHHAGWVSGVRTGFDPAWAAAGAGSVMMARSIADLSARGDTVFDLGPDYLEAKRPWWTHLTASDRYLHYAAGSPRARLLQGARACKSLWARLRKRGSAPAPLVGLEPSGSTAPPRLSVWHPEPVDQLPAEALSQR